MGTPAFAARSLQKLIDEGYEIPLVVTQPDRKGNRNKMILSEVRQLALEHGIETAQPVTEAEKPEEDAREAAQARVEAVAAAVRTSAADDEDLARTCRMLRRGFITEDEAKRLLLFPVSVTCPPLLALPAPAEVPDAVTVSVVDPVAVVAAACAACSSVTVPEACRDIDGSREAEERGSSRTEAEAPPGNSSSDRSAACCSVSRGSGPGYISAAICAFSDRPAACCACSICYYDTS